MMGRVCACIIYVCRVMGALNRDEEELKFAACGEEGARNGAQMKIAPWEAY